LTYTADNFQSAKF